MMYNNGIEMESCVFQLTGRITSGCLEQELVNGKYEMSLTCDDFGAECGLRIQNPSINHRYKIRCIDGTEYKLTSYSFNEKYGQHDYFFKKSDNEFVSVCAKTRLPNSLDLGKTYNFIVE